MPIRALALAEPVNRRSPTSFAAAQAQSNALLFTATQDKLHQPYRGALMPPSTELIALFRSKGLCRRSLRCRPLRARAALRQRPRSHRPDRIGSSLLPAIGVCFTCPSTPPASKSSVAKSRRRLPLGELAAAGGLRVVRHTGRDHLSLTSSDSSRQREHKDLSHAHSTNSCFPSPSLAVTCCIRRVSAPHSRLACG